MADALLALLLGIVEGLTEFIPVSSTAHLLLLSHFLGFESAGETFAVAIQLGAVLALVVVYLGLFLRVAQAAPRDPAARRFLASVALAFLPAAIFGVLAHGVIKGVLFESPGLIAVMLILGGLVLVLIDRIAPAETYPEATALPIRTALAIGFFQCLALVPGVSRSGATIVGARLIGVSKRAAAEFSFFLSIPTMFGAVTYDLWANRDTLDLSAIGHIAIGFTAALVTALAVVRWVLGYVSRHGYALFGWWRIFVGVLVLVLIGRNG